MTSPVSPSETIAKAMEGKNRIQGMVRSIDQYRNCDPKAIADGSYAQILYALTDDKHDILVLWDFAVAAALQLEAMQREMAELRRIISECAESIGNGAYISPNCSVEFMAGLPREISLHIESLPSPKHFDVLAETLAEVKATGDGLSDQPISEIMAGCLEELDALPNSLRRARTLIQGEKK